jgi:hypothetical protein
MARYILNGLYVEKHCLGCIIDWEINHNRLKTPCIKEINRFLSQKPIVLHAHQIAHIRATTPTKTKFI